MAIPVCNRCHSPLDGGPHLHVEQCLKAKKQDCESLQHSLILMALNARDLQQELRHANNLLWGAVSAMGGSVQVPDKPAVTIPEGHTRNLMSKRNDANDGFELKAVVEAPPPTVQ